MKISIWKKFIKKCKEYYRQEQHKRMLQLIDYFKYNKDTKGTIKGFTIQQIEPISLNIFTEVTDAKMAELIEHFSKNKLSINTFYLIKGDRDNRKQIETNIIYN